MIATGLIASSFLVPKWLFLVLFLPIMMVLGNIGFLPPLVSVGDADIQIYDVIVVIIAVRVLLAMIVGRYRVHSVPSLFAFFTVLFVATALNYFRFGPGIFASQMTAFARYAMQGAVLFLVVHSIRRPRQLWLVTKTITLIGYLLILPVYVNALFFSSGVAVGEVVSSRGIIRFFGPVGDQIGFMILFFVFKELVAGRMLQAAIFGVAVVATGTRAALITLIVGVIILTLRSGRGASRPSWVPLYAGAFLLLISPALWFDLGGMWSRFSNPTVLEGGFTQRMATMRVATDVVIDNPIVGVGFSGFRQVALDYDVEGWFRGLYYPHSFISTASNQFLQVATDGGVIAVAAFVVLILSILRAFDTAASCSSGELRNVMLAGYAWTVAMAFGTHTAVWLTAGSLIAHLLWVMLALAVLAANLGTADSPPRGAE
jgi:O-antigen ligase/polysaccharide polymerase Wzy-like membrane protein